MRKRSSKAATARDENQTAFDAVQHVIKLTEASAERSEKNPAAVALGRLGGLKGGPARKAALSPRRRSQLARKAVRARWKKAKSA
jgi:hypothetical protein